MITLKQFRLRKNDNTVDTIYKKIISIGGIKYLKSEVEYYSEKGGKVKKGDFSYESISKDEFDAARKKHENQKEN